MLLFIAFWIRKRGAEKHTSFDDSRPSNVRRVIATFKFSAHRGRNVGFRNSFLRPTRATTHQLLFTGFFSPLLQHPTPIDARYISAPAPTDPHKERQNKPDTHTHTHWCQLLLSPSVSFSLSSILKVFTNYFFVLVGS